MIVAVQNVYYQNRMFKPNDQLPCYDIKMVQAWLASGVAIDTEKNKKGPNSLNSKNSKPKNKDSENEEVNTEKETGKDEAKEEIKKPVANSKITKIKTRSGNKKQ